MKKMFSLFSIFLFSLLLIFVIPASANTMPGKQEASFEYWYDKGLISRKAKNHEQAIEDFTKAIQIESTRSLFLKQNYVKVYLARGYSYSLLNQYDQAIADFTKVIQIDPANPRPYFLLGTSYGAMEKYDQAEINLIKALQLDPDDFSTHQVLGYLYYKLQKYDLSIRYYTQALQLNPTYYMIYSDRAHSYLRSEQFDLAIEDLLKACELTPKSAANYYYNIAFAHYKLENDSQALKYYRLFLETRRPDQMNKETEWAKQRIIELSN